MKNIFSFKKYNNFVKPKFFNHNHNFKFRAYSFDAPLIGKKSLNNIVKLELLQNKTPTQIEEIWREYHKKNFPRDIIAAVVRKGIFKKLKERANENPLFVIPIPKNVGYVTYFFQWKDNVALYTPLDKYKQLGDKALPELTCIFYEDLAEEKGIVLMRGEIGGRQLQVHEAQYLGNQTSIIYSDNYKYQSVETFNKRPEEFSFDALLDEIIAEKKK